jgi:hypothetical protein
MRTGKYISNYSRKTEHLEDKEIDDNILLKWSLYMVSEFKQCKIRDFHGGDYE